MLYSLRIWSSTKILPDKEKTTDVYFCECEENVQATLQSINSIALTEIFCSEHIVLEQ